MCTEGLAYPNLSMGPGTRVAHSLPSILVDFRFCQTFSGLLPSLAMRAYHFHAVDQYLYSADLKSLWACDVVVGYCLG